MYNDEIGKRKQFAYPPFSRMIQLSFKHKMKGIVDRAAEEFANALKRKYNSYMVGPAEPVVSRVRNQFLMDLILKLPRDSKTISQCKKDILDQVALIHQDKRFRSVVIVADVDGV